MEKGMSAAQDDGMPKSFYSVLKDVAQEISALKAENAALKQRLEEAEKAAKYVKPFGEAMNDYHQAYLKQTKKVFDLEAQLAQKSAELVKILEFKKGVGEGGI